MQTTLRSNPQQLNITNGETKILHILDGAQLCCWLPFFLEGLTYLQERTGWQISSLSFLKVVFRAFNGVPRHGLVLVQVGAQGPLGFLIAHDVSDVHDANVAQIFAVYTNRLCPSSFLELTNMAFQWGRAFGFHRMLAQSHKIRRSSVARFRKIFDGQPIITFTKDL